MLLLHEYTKKKKKIILVALPSRFGFLTWRSTLINCSNIYARTQKSQNAN